MFLVKCSGCNGQLSVSAEMAGKTGKCSKCGTIIQLSPLSKPVAQAIPATDGQGRTQRQIPASASPRPASPPAGIQPPRPPINQPTLAAQSLAAPLSPQLPAVNSLLAPFLNEEQDPTAVAQAYERVQQIVTRGEEILYIAVQKKPVVNITPDCAVLTSRRFIIYHAKLLGRSDFDDYIWRDLFDARLKEGMLGATLTMRTVQGRTVSIDYLPKLQARKLYRFAQEMEEKVREERRVRQMEEHRAAAGGIVIQGATGTAPTAPAPIPASTPHDDPVQKLQQLKAMLDGGLISADEFAAKKAGILSKM